MRTHDTDTPSEVVATIHTCMTLVAAAELQDNLIVAGNDLERLQGLLDDASQSLLTHFHGARQHMNQALRDTETLTPFDDSPVREALQTLGGAITSLQFQDMATQLISHTKQRLRNWADRLAYDTLGDEENDIGVIDDAPLRPNPVTQDGMDAGSIELF